MSAVPEESNTIAPEPQEEVRRPDTQNRMGGKIGHWGWREVCYRLGSLPWATRGTQQCSTLRAKRSRWEPEEPRVN